MVHWTPVLAGENALGVWPHHLRPIEINGISNRPRKCKIVTRVTQHGSKPTDYASIDVTLELKNDSNASSYDSNKKILVASNPGKKKVSRSVSAISDTYSISIALTLEKDESCFVSLSGQVKHKALADFSPRIIYQGMEMKIWVKPDGVYTKDPFVFIASMNAFKFDYKAKQFLVEVAYGNHLQKLPSSKIKSARMKARASEDERDCFAEVSKDTTKFNISFVHYDTDRRYIAMS